MSKRNRLGQSAVLSNLEVEKIYQSFNSDRDKLIWMILCATGERISAVLALGVCDVYRIPEKSQHWEEITFPARIRKRRPDGSRETRQVPITRKLSSELLRYSPPKNSEFLFPSPLNPLKHLTRQTYDELFREALQRCGLDRIGASLHSPRRTLATRLFEEGNPLNVIQKITGHRSIAVLQRYVDVSDAQVKSALEML